ncbi:tubulin glycylase 3A [Musca domestica]|uniref:Tubulin glycylase 3A n=1 Tax=Musca domestica TaxID=7370 RepID=A0A1I8MX16_MUSDO|nr:tubulin glycylase 3A [Musca domestica]
MLKTVIEQPSSLEHKTNVEVVLQVEVNKEVTNSNSEVSKSGTAQENENENAEKEINSHVCNENIAVVGGGKASARNPNTKQIKSAKREKLTTIFSDEANSKSISGVKTQQEAVPRLFKTKSERQFNHKHNEILVTDAIRKLTKKSVTTIKDKQQTPNDATPITSNGSVIIDKQVSVSGPFKKVKCIYTILNNDQINTLRRHAQDAVKQNKIFTIRGNYNSVRHALKTRGWVEKLEYHRKSVFVPSTQINPCDLSQVLPKRRTGETQRQFIAKVERNIMSRYIEHVPCDLLWTPHKEKADYVEQSKNPNMLINKFNRAPFTNKENLNSFLRDIAAFYEEGVAESRFPRCYNVWSPEELGEFIEHFKLTACIAFVRWLVERYQAGGFDVVFSATGKVPFTCIEFAYKRCHEYLDACQHNDIDSEDPNIWEHDWDAFLNHHYQLTHEGFKILADPQKIMENIIIKGAQILDSIVPFWPQYSIDGYQNLWIIKPANKCRGRGIMLSNNLKKIVNIVNPPIASKSRYVVQKYMERPLIIHQTKFDIRQWFLISSINPLMIWMYKECYLRFSSQEYTLTNHHESVHLTNHAIQKKYTNNGKRDKRLPSENMWDSYSFQAYLRQIGKQEVWLERIYPGMRKAIVAAILVSQDHMERTPNTFELFGADFMICENFYPWLIEINSNPDLGATTSVTARMCPQCLEDVIKVVIDRRNDFKADVGNFELIYRQVIPPTPAYMGLNLIVKGRQISNRGGGGGHHHNSYGYHRKEKSLQTSQIYKQRTTLALSNVSQTHNNKPAMPAFNATEYIEKCLNVEMANSPRSTSVPSLIGLTTTDRKLLPPTTPATTDSRSKSFVSLATGTVKRMPSTKTPAIANPICDVYSTLKRHRSCGPRLNTHCGANTNTCKDLQKSKFFVASYNQQKAINSSRSAGRLKNNHLDAPSLSISKSADNIKELYNSPLKNNVKMNKSLSPLLPASRTPKTRLESIGGKVKKQAEPNPTTIHAIGRGIASWNTKRKLVVSKTHSAAPPIAMKHVD